MKEVSPADRFPQANTSEDEEGHPLEGEAWPNSLGVGAQQEAKILLVVVCPWGICALESCFDSSRKRFTFIRRNC